MKKTIVVVLSIVVIFSVVSFADAKEEVIKKWEENGVRYEVTYLTEVDLVCFSHNVLFTKLYGMQCWDGIAWTNTPSGIVDVLREWRSRKNK